MNTLNLIRKQNTSIRLELSNHAVLRFVCNQIHAFENADFRFIKPCVHDGNLAKVNPLFPRIFSNFIKINHRLSKSGRPCKQKAPNGLFIRSIFFVGNPATISAFTVFCPINGCNDKSEKIAVFLTPRKPVFLAIFDRFDIFPVNLQDKMDSLRFAEIIWNHTIC
jgi:hypothetical protein